MRRASTLFVPILALILLLTGLYLLVINPFDWFLQKSDRFSIDEFIAVEAGDEFSEVTDLLGEPIFEKNLPPYIGCDGCSIHYFLGAPPDWLIGHREAWVIVDARGKVVQRILNDEP